MKVWPSYGNGYIFQWKIYYISVFGLVLSWWRSLLVNPNCSKINVCTINSFLLSMANLADLSLSALDHCHRVFTYSLWNPSGELLPLSSAFTYGKGHTIYQLQLVHIFVKNDLKWYLYISTDINARNIGNKFGYFSMSLGMYYMLFYGILCYKNYFLVMLWLVNFRASAAEVVLLKHISNLDIWLLFLYSLHNAVLGGCILLSFCPSICPLRSHRSFKPLRLGLGVS